MKTIGDKHNADISQVALNWLLKDEGVIPIPGAKCPEHVDSHVNATKWKMSDEDYKSISKISGELRLNSFYNFGDA
jgi:diketogulonate reductase-like aldo/keto reductase